MAVSLDPKFEALFADGLPTKAADMAAAAATGSQPPPAHIGPADDAPSPHLAAEVAAFYSSELSDERYRVAMTGGSGDVRPTLASAMGAKLQSDSVARAERSAKMAGLTRVRAFALDASRRNHDGGPSGGYLAAIVAGVRAYDELRGEP